MESIIQVFRMTEISIATRIRIIKALGREINNQLAMNATEGLVYELVLALDPNDAIKDDAHYKRFAGVDV